MGYQFIHFNLYGKIASKERQRQSRQRSLSAAEVVAEAVREIGACPHVENPVPAKIIWGESPEMTLFNATLSFDNEPKVTVKTKHGIKYRSVREDTPILLAGVCSWPYTEEEMTAEPEKATFFDEWIKLSVKFLEDEYGEALRSIILHTDEHRPHLHFFVSAEKAIETKKLHAGASAKSKTAACDGLRGFQDRYFETASLPCGLTRMGPKRKRLTRPEWKAKQAEARATAELLAKTESRANRKLKVVLKAVRKLYGNGELPEEFRQFVSKELAEKTSPPAPASPM